MSNLMILPSISTNAISIATFEDDNATEPIEHTVSQIRPWVRYFARIIDILIFSFLVGFSLAFIAPSVLDIPEIVLTMGILFVWVFQESVLLANCGTTPGKWLFKIKVRDSRGRKLKFSDALNRSFSVWLKGMGAGIPLISLITLLTSRSKLKNDGVTAWDEEGGYVVRHGKIGALRSIVIVILLLGFFSLSAWENTLEEREALTFASNSVESQNLFPKAVYAKPAKDVVTGKYGTYAIEYDPSIWMLNKEQLNTDTEYEFSHIEGGAYAMVIHERISVPFDVLENFVIENAKNVATNVRMVSREMITLGDKMILSMKYECTIMAVPFVYHSYLSSSEEGTIQFITYTTKPLGETFEHDCHALLTGLALGS